MSYTKNFQMRSFANIIRNGRFRTPVGSSLVIGEPVTVDPDSAGFVKQVAAGAAPTQASGAVVYEHIQKKGVDPLLTTSSDAIFTKVPGGAFAQMVHGTGVKVALKNTASRTLYDGHTVAAAGLLASSVNVGTLKPGDGLTPDGAGKYKKAGTTDGVWLVVESTNAATGVVEASFTF